MDVRIQARMIGILVRAFPAVPAICLFGSFGTSDQADASDIDIAILLPPDRSKSVRPMKICEVRAEVETALHRDVDPVHVREAY